MALIVIDTRQMAEYMHANGIDSEQLDSNENLAAQCLDIAEELFGMKSTVYNSLKAIELNENKE